MVTHQVKDGQFLKDVVAGLTGTPKTLPCKYFYDERGSRLFDAICELDEYYPTRTELAILEQHAGEMAAQIGPTVMLVEPGSGSSLKTRLLLDRLEDPVAYVPVDISCAHLKLMAGDLEADYPMLEVLPVCADFTTRFALPKSQRQRPAISAVYFPGSTIGNFLPEAAERLLGWMGEVVGVGGGLLIGVDLVKDRRVLEAAYNDREGVTAEFNLNLLRRINDELGADFDLNGFEHRARYNEHKQQGGDVLDLDARSRK